MGEERLQDRHTQVIAVIKAMTGQANLLTIPRAFLGYTGTLDSALFLSQVIYWSDRGICPDGWFYKTYVEWKTEIGIGEYEIRKAVMNLKGKGVLETKVKKANGNPTVHYRINWDEFSDSFLEFLKEPTSNNSRNESVETAGTYNRTETTADITPYLLRDAEEKEDKKESVTKEEGSAVTPRKKAQHTQQIPIEGDTWPSVELLRKEYNELSAPECAEASRLSPERTKRVQKYLTDFPEQKFWHEVFQETHKSRWLRGLEVDKQGRPFKVRFDWLLSVGKDGTENCVKVYEGNYRDDKTRRS